jgi:hypothetical protein
MVKERKLRRIRKIMEPKSTDDLLKIWTENNRYEYYDETFTVIKQLLIEREIPVPQQNQPYGQVTKEDKEPSLISVTTIIAFIAGIILLTIGLLIDPGVSAQTFLPGTYSDFKNMTFMPNEVVNLHKLHIKQTLYYFSDYLWI